MINDEIKYFQLSHNQNTGLLEEEDETRISLGLFYTVASIKEETIGREINKFFKIFIPIIETDNYKISLYLFDKYKKIKRILQGDIIKNMNQMLNSETKRVFEFNYAKIKELSKILFYCYDILTRNSKKYNINNHNELKDAIRKIREQNIDAMKYFFNKSNDKENPCVSFIIPKKRNNDFLFTIFNEEEKNVSSRNNSQKLKFRGDIFSYYPNKLCNYEIPIEMILLINKFQFVQKIVFSIERIEDEENESDDNLIIYYLIVLFNIDWLFPNMFELELKYENNKLKMDLNDYLERKTNKIVHSNNLIAKRTHYDRDLIPKICWRTSEEEKTVYNDYDCNETKASKNLLPQKNLHSFKTTLLNHKNELNMIIIFSFFAKRTMNSIKCLYLNFSDCYSKEIEYYLQYLNIKMYNFHFLSFISNINNLIQFETNFNCLNSVSFEKIIGIIFNNNKLSVLRMKLFSSEDIYSPGNLWKLCTMLQYNLNLVKAKSQIDLSNNNEELDKIIINLLINDLEENLEKLFLVLKTKVQLNEIIFNLEMPNLIANNELYMILFLKFALNMILLLSYCELKLKVFKFIAPSLKCDPRKNDDCDMFFNNINMQNNTLHTLTLQIQIVKTISVSNLITDSLEYLFLGDFDDESFENFCDIFSNESFQKNSKLKEVKLSLSRLVLSYANIKKAVGKYLNASLSDLNKQALYSYIPIDKDEFGEMLYQISFNPVEKFVFEFTEKNNPNQNSIIYKLSKDIKSTSFNDYITIKSYKEILRKKHIHFKSIDRILNLLTKGDIKDVKVRFKIY